VVGRGLEDRRQVDGGDPQVFEIVEMLDDAAQVAALETEVRRRRVPRFEDTRLVDAVAGGEPVGEDLVEDRVPDPGGGVDAHRRSCVTAGAGVWGGPGPWTPGT